MRALITGMSGFVGSHLADYLLTQANWEVSGTVQGRTDNIDHLRGRLTLYPADLSRPDVVGLILEEAQPDAIFHLAAQAVPALSMVDPWFTLENNIRAQLNILERVVQMRLPCRVLVVGSSEEYGDVRPEDLPISEDVPLRPTNPYAVSKVTQDLLGLQYYLAHRVQAIRVRPFNHIGPRQRQGFVAADFAAQIAAIEAGRQPPEVVVGTLDVERDFSDVRDIVRGYYLALTQGQPGEVYNLGAGRSYSIRNLLDTLIAQCRRPVKVVQDPAKQRPVNVPRVVADCTRLHVQTGWRPAITFEQSLHDVLDDWRGQVRRGTTGRAPPNARPERRAAD